MKRSSDLCNVMLDSGRRCTRKHRHLGYHDGSPFVLVQDEPYDLRLTLDGHTIATFNLDDAPVRDWNDRVERIARFIEDSLDGATADQLRELTALK